MDLHNSEYSVDDLRSGKVKLEFGNKDHIEKIDRETRDKEVEKTIGEYEVEIRYSGSALITIKAWDEDEAEEEVKGDFSFLSLSELDFEIDDVETTCIKEPKEEDPS